jgi:O6-methylguanine-DNA--protein-cysteine methyltransferase
MAQDRGGLNGQLRAQDDGVRLTDFQLRLYQVRRAARVRMVVGFVHIRQLAIGCLIVFQACRCIPCGKVTTYGALAKLLASSARAVGQVWGPGSIRVDHSTHSVARLDRLH